MRIRLLFEKTEAVRFISHLDTMRAFSRALRRAGIPLSFSLGFNPHPKMSFALPLAVGMTSSHDVLDLGTEIPVELRKLVDDLNASLPAGFRVTSAREIAEGGPSAMSEVGAAEYRMRAPITNDAVDPRDAVRRFLDSREVPVERRREGKPSRIVDIRSLVLRLDGMRDGGHAAFDTVIRSGSAANARPDEVLQGIDSMGGGWLDLAGARYHREGLFRIAGERIEPLT